MPVLVSEITDRDGKTHYAGRNSNIERIAHSKGFSIRSVHISGHHIPATVNGLVHYKGVLPDGPILIDGKPADPSQVATIAEHRIFLSELFRLHTPNKHKAPLQKVA